jgi:hypothetical protein
MIYSPKAKTEGIKFWCAGSQHFFRMGVGGIAPATQLLRNEVSEPPADCSRRFVRAWGAGRLN